MTNNQLQQIKRRFNITGNSPGLHRALNLAMQVADTDLGVLITGENGSGKESFAKIIHYLSSRKHNKYIVVNCGAIPEGTIDSELFGHEKGAFTSASDTRKGYFEEADQGTIFLDEIGDMPIHTQPRLLRVLENKEYMRVGSSKKRLADTRVIAATNINLHDHISKRKFRQDLFYRIAQVQIAIPPLRERKEDILPLFNKFSLDFANAHQSRLIELTPEAKQRLVAYPFPGNIRQLKNITWQLAILEGENRPIDEPTLAGYLPKASPLTNLPAISTREKTTITPDREEILYRTLFEIQHEVQEMKRTIFRLLGNDNQMERRAEEDPLVPMTYLDLSKKKEAKASLPQMIVLPDDANEQMSKEDADLSIKKNEKRLITQAIIQSKNYKEAAEKLGISERTLYRKIQEYELSS